jgi:predicted GNAT superfamily acetyltransferase
MSENLKPAPSPAQRWGLDLEAILHLNNTEAVATSWLEPGSLAALLSEAFYVGHVAAGADAFLIAFDERASYEGINYRWFCSRLARFVYIDRIVVNAACRGQGLARRLYAQLAEAARQAGHTEIVCEVNFDPPNPVSDAFHAALGFREVGRGSPMPGKVVRYLAWSLA